MKVVGRATRLPGDGRRISASGVQRHFLPRRLADAQGSRRHCPAENPVSQPAGRQACAVIRPSTGWWWSTRAPTQCGLDGRRRDLVPPERQGRGSTERRSAGRGRPGCGAALRGGEIHPLSRPENILGCRWVIFAFRGDHTYKNGPHPHCQAPGGRSGLDDGSVIKSDAYGTLFVEAFVCCAGRLVQRVSDSLVFFPTPTGQM